jgi:hypothetical protein
MAQSEGKAEVAGTEGLDAEGIYIRQLPGQELYCARMVEMVPIPGWITAKTGHKDASHVLVVFFTALTSAQVMNCRIITSPVLPSLWRAYGKAGTPLVRAASQKNMLSIYGGIFHEREKNESKTGSKREENERNVSQNHLFQPFLTPIYGGCLPGGSGSHLYHSH